MKVSSNSEMVRGMALWNFFGALRELMLRNVKDQKEGGVVIIHLFRLLSLFYTGSVIVKSILYKNHILPPTPFVGQTRISL